MAPFRLARPRIVTYFLLEGALIFAVLYGLAVLTPLVNPPAAQTDFLVPVLLSGVAFTGLLLLTQFQTVLTMALYAYSLVGASLTPALLAAFLWKRVTPQGGVACIAG